MAFSAQMKIFKVTCSDWNGAVRGRPYRKIAVQEKATLYELAVAILESFDFDTDHMFGFYDNLKSWTNATEGYELFADMGQQDLFPGVKKTKANTVFLEPKQKFLLLFDYGDEWRFIVQFLGDEPLNRNLQLPAVLQSFGESPDQYEEWMDEEFEHENGMDIQLEGISDKSGDELVRDERIQVQIINDAYGPEEQMLSWYTYLGDTLSFPFNGICAEIHEQSPLLEGEKVRVLGLASIEHCHDCIRVKVNWETRTFSIPLEQLLPVRTNKEARQAIEDWNYWIKS